MKKILLATTLLAGSTSFAMAEAHIAWSGSAAAGIASNGLDNGGQSNPDGAADEQFGVYSNASAELTLSGSTDNGLTFGTSIDQTTGRSYGLGHEDGFDGNGGTFGFGGVFISGGFGKVEIADDDFDFERGSTTGDVKYTGTFGTFGVGVIADVDSGEVQFSGDFTVGPVSIAANVDTLELFGVSAEFKVNDSTTFSASTNDDGDSVVGVALSSGSISASADFNTSDESIDLAGGYSANGLSVDAELNTVSESWTVTIGYDLGGGLALEAGTNYTGDIMAGATMSF